MYSSLRQKVDSCEFRNGDIAFSLQIQYREAEHALIVGHS
jgi:hypothetical protein